MRECTIGTRSQLGNFRTSTERYGSINLQPLSWTGVVVVHVVGYRANNRKVCRTFELFKRLIRMTSNRYAYWLDGCWHISTVLPGHAARVTGRRAWNEFGARGRRGRTGSLREMEIVNLNGVFNKLVTVLLNGPQFQVYICYDDRNIILATLLHSLYRT